MKIENENWIRYEERKSKMKSQNRKRKLKIEYAIENGLSKMFDKNNSEGEFNE